MASYVLFYSMSAVCPRVLPVSRRHSLALYPLGIATHAINRNAVLLPSMPIFQNKPRISQHASVSPTANHGTSRGLFVPEDSRDNQQRLDNC